MNKTSGCRPWYLPKIWPRTPPDHVRRSLSTNSGFVQNTSKTGRKPKPLTLLGLDSFPTIQYDAANSITDFQSIMDETAPSPSSLSSTPHLSLHPALRNSRSRSHTAPPTPIGEIPFIAELPGSLLQENEGYPATHQMSGDILLLGSEKMPPTFSNGLSLNSSNTSPQLSGSVANHKRSASENSAILTHNTQQKRDSSLPPIQRIISGDRNRPFSFISHETSDSKSQQISEQISSRYNGVSSQSSLHTVDDSMRQGNPQVSGTLVITQQILRRSALKYPTFVVMSIRVNEPTRLLGRCPV